MFKHSIIFALILLITIPMMGAENVVKHGNSFLLGGRKVVIITHKTDTTYNSQIAKFLTASGAQVVEGMAAKVIYPRLVITRGEIEGKTGDGFSIKVSRNKIAIRYTSDQYATKAIEYLQTLYDEPFARQIIRGVNVISIERRIKTNNMPGINGSVVDCASKYLALETIQAALRRLSASGKRDVIVLLGSPDAMRLNMECFTLFNPNQAIVAPKESYSPVLSSNLTRFGTTNNIKITLGVDLLSENKNFENWSGHQINSVEGMRLVRAIIEELAHTWGVDRLYIGQSTDTYANDVRYRAFLSKIATDNRVELVIL
ncbi:MAG: hypothetical protein RR921_03245 [Mucinivorans sp.]